MKNKLADILLKYDLATADSLPIILYGLEYFFLLMINTLTPLVLLCIVGGLSSGLFFMAILAVIRTYAGGYHAGRRLTCFIYSQVTILGVTFLSGIIKLRSPLFLLICGVCSLCIFLLSPKFSRYKKVTPEQVYRHKIICRFLAVIYLCLAVILFEVKQYTLYFDTFSALLLQTISLIVPEATHK